MLTYSLGEYSVYLISLSFTAKVKVETLYRDNNVKFINYVHSTASNRALGADNILTFMFWALAIKFYALSAS